MTTDPGIMLGTSLASKGEIRMPVENGNHVFALGGTNSGKTVALKIIAESLLLRRIPVIAFDTLNSAGDIAGLAVPITSHAGTRILGLDTGVDPEIAEDRQREGLGDQVRIATDIAASMSKMVATRVIAPFTDEFGERIALPPLTSRPNGYEILMRDRDALALQADSVAYGFIQRISLAKKTNDGVDPTRNVICDAILRAWEQDLPLDGPDGIATFLGHLAVYNQEIAKDGGAISDDEMAKIDKNARALTRGKDRSWLDGTPLDMTTLMTPTAPNKVPLLVVRLCHLGAEDRPWVVGRIIDAAVNWASKQGDPGHKPRLGLIVDEIASGAGPREKLLVGLNYSGHPSSGALRSAWRKGRHAGVLVCCGSQNPRDVDGKSLNNIRTRIIGRVSADDAKIALQGSDISSDALDNLVKTAASLPPGSMAYNGPTVGRSGGAQVFRLRILATVHKKIADHDLAKLQQAGLIRRSAPVADPRQAALDDLTRLGARHASCYSVEFAKAIMAERERLRSQLSNTEAPAVSTAEG